MASKKFDLIKPFILIICLLISTSCDKPGFKEQSMEISLIQQQIIAGKVQTRDSLLALYPDNPELQEAHRLTVAAEASIKDFRFGLTKYLTAKSKGGEINYLDYTTHEAYTIGEAMDGEGFKLVKNLRAYVNSINSLDSSFRFDQFALTQNELDELTGTEVVQKDSPNMIFYNLPNGVIYTLLDHYHMEILEIEIQAIDDIISGSLIKR